MKSLSVENLRITEPDDLSKRQVDFAVASSPASIGRGQPCCQRKLPTSAWCSPRTVRQQPEVRLLLLDLKRARAIAERQENSDTKLESIDAPRREAWKARPSSAVTRSSASDSCQSSDEVRPSTSRNRASTSLLSMSTVTPFEEDKIFDDSARSSIVTSYNESPRKRVVFRRRHKNGSTGSFSKRVLSSTLVKGDQWNKRRTTTLDPVLQRVTVHITNFRNPKEEVSAKLLCYLLPHNTSIAPERRWLNWFIRKCKFCLIELVSFKMNRKKSW